MKFDIHGNSWAITAERNALVHVCDELQLGDQVRYALRYTGASQDNPRMVTMRSMREHGTDNAYVHNRILACLLALKLEGKDDSNFAARHAQ